MLRYLIAPAMLAGMTFSFSGASESAYAHPTVSSLFSGPTCPATDSIAQRKLRWVLTSPGAGAFRNSHGLTPGDTATIRLLAAPNDSTACRHLAEIYFPKRRTVYYAIGARYIAVMGKDSVESGLKIRPFTGFALIDSTYNLIAHYDE